MRVPAISSFLFVLLPLLVVLLVFHPVPTTALKYTYTLVNSNSLALSSITLDDVINLSQATTINIQVANTGATSFSFQDIQASSTGLFWVGLQPYKASHTESSAPFNTYTVGSNPTAINLASLYSSSGFQMYRVMARDSRDSTWDTLIFYVDYSYNICSWTQGGYANGPVCQNGGTCVPQLIDSICTCPGNFGGSNCSSCNAGWSGTSCNTCAAGYYGSTCAACPACGSQGTCSQGLKGTGLCQCAVGWTGATCSSCATGWTGTTCSTCATGYYGVNCTACPNCGNGTCSQGSSGTGTCTCNAGWVSANGGVCNTCATGYYGPTCAACPACGSHGNCSQGITGTGVCACTTGWASLNGGNCNACGSNYYGQSCAVCPSCGTQGTCNSGSSGTGSCTCNAGWINSTTGNCNTCASGYFGLSCTACPACGSHGTCSQGSSGTGTCTCAAGWVSYGGGNCNACGSTYYGASCLPCPGCGNGTCNAASAGTTGGTGNCTCNAGWVSANGGVCNACASGYYGSTCATCPACGSHGSCSQALNGTGTCICSAGWVSSNGGNCNACGSNYYGQSCTLCPGCGNGVCSQGINGTGACTCNAGWVSANGGNCNACASGYYGPTCALCPTCGLEGTCSQGITGTGACVCALGWANTTSANCATCSPNFSGTDCTQCAAGYYGQNCTACPACNSHSSCNAGRSGNGSCICYPTFTSSPTGLCDLCIQGFTGTSCSQCLANRYGPNCLTCPLCGEGSCSQGINGTGACSCNPGWSLDVNGACTQCLSGYYGSNCTACPSCGNGACSSGYSGTGQCICATGWAVDSTGACNVCASGYFGPNCTACPNCGNGACSDSLSGNGTCSCSFPWISANGGNCNTCSQGFTGQLCNQCVDGNYPDCFVAIACPGNCRGNGVCNFRTGVCSCDAGFVNFDCGECVLSQLDTYPNCTKGILCPNNCSGHGSCNTNLGVCTCYPGFTSSNCTTCLPGYEDYPLCYRILTCPNNCSGQGTCSDETGLCTCMGNYGGTDCSSCKPGFSTPSQGCWPIIPCPDDCSGHGTCNQQVGNCSCAPSYFGSGCETQLQCYSGPCQNGGTCSEVFATHSYNCSCSSDFTGDNCQYSLIPPVVTTVSPLVASLTGTTLTVTGSNFQAPVTVTMSQGSLVLGSVSVDQVTPATRKRSNQVFSFVTPATSTRGFVTLTFTNPAGTSVEFVGLFLTSVCPLTNTFPQAGNCSACPSNAVCPGGELIIPAPGSWSPDSFTAPITCPPPASRCPGGAPDNCAEGYEGELCVFCVPGYQKTASTGACDVCPAIGCGSTVRLTPSFTFFLICLVVVVALALGLLLYKNVKRIRQRLSRRDLKLDLAKRLNKTEFASEHEIAYLAQPRTSFSESESEFSYVNLPLQSGAAGSTSKAVSQAGISGPSATQPLLGPEPAFNDPYEPPFWNSPSAAAASSAVTPGYIPVQVPVFDAEAICLDRTLRSIPTRDNLYSQILKISRTDLACARIAHQVAKKILREHQHQIFTYDAAGETTGIANELEIQKLVDRYIDESAWRVVGALNALAKKGSFGRSSFQKQHFDLPYAVQISEDRGPKPAMENRWFVQLFANELFGLGLTPNVSVLGLYDGFGGTEAAEFVARHLHVNLFRNDNFKRNPHAAFYEAFLQTNEGFSHIVQSNRLPDVVGCTAVVAVIRAEEIWVAWVGDCQAVLFKDNGQYICFCDPHTPANDLERDRVEALGGVISDRGGQLRLGGMYPITRAFGCVRQRRVITAEPDVIAFDLQGGEQYLVLANGPFWNALSSQAVSSFLGQFRGASASGIADALVQYARSLGCVDNLTVQVLVFASSTSAGGASS